MPQSAVMEGQLLSVSLLLRHLDDEYIFRIVLYLGCLCLTYLKDPSQWKCGTFRKAWTCFKCANVIIFLNWLYTVNFL